MLVFSHSQNDNFDSKCYKSDPSNLRKDFPDQFLTNFDRFFLKGGGLTIQKILIGKIEVVKKGGGGGEVSVFFTKSKKNSFLCLP